MLQYISKSDFRFAFEKAGRAGHFSYDGLGALYDYLCDNYSSYELDVIELCCDFVEYDCFDSCQLDYPEVRNFSDLSLITTLILIDDNSFIIYSI